MSLFKGKSGCVASLILLLLVVSAGPNNAMHIKIDPNGYVLYCPCMGRFGNQADHFLGSLAFAAGLNRTFVIPPWIEYTPGKTSADLIPYNTYFNVSNLELFHRVVTMETFFDKLADQVWPKGERISFCYTSRSGPEGESCNAKDGNPFGPFWDGFGVGFDSSEKYGPLNYDVHHGSAVKDWDNKYPADKFPVVAFTGAPAAFPVQTDNIHLQKYVRWNDEWTKRGREWKKTNLGTGPYVGIHLRNGVDWQKACTHIGSSSHLFSSPQCLGYRNEMGRPTSDMCLPSGDLILKQVRRAVKEVKAVAVFVASDNDHMAGFLENKLKKAGVKVARQSKPINSHLDLVILGKSNHFIGNCISSFSAFVKRERDLDGLPSSFWGFPTPKSGAKHEEL